MIYWFLRRFDMKIVNKIRVFGILFIILGIIGIYLARIHQALQQRPQFVVADAINIDDTQ